MKTTGRFLILTVIMTVLITINYDLLAQQNVGQLFEKALYLEEAKGELQGAIDLYNQIVENKDADPSIQAKALLHLGMCYEKMGNDEALKAYQ